MVCVCVCECLPYKSFENLGVCSAFNWDEQIVTIIIRAIHMANLLNPNKLGL